MATSTVTFRIAESRPTYGGGHGAPLSEKLLARLWQRRAARQAEFRTNGGRRVRVLYPGREGTGAGPDFRDALLEVEGLGLVQGDVELHLKQRDWDAHGHGTDPNYNGVVLHAALEVGPQRTLLHSGQEAPVVSLASLWESELGQPALATEDGSQPLEPPPEASVAEANAAETLWRLLATQGYARPETPAALAQLLDRAGDARFQRKSARYQTFLREQSPEQTIYEGILEALGYRHNQHPFLRLATIAPYSALERAARSLPPEEREPAIRSWLLRLAGLGTPDDPGNIKLPRTGFGSPMSAREWHCFRVRPANHPRRRVEGAARLVARYLEAGLLPSLTALASEDRPQAVSQGLLVAADPAQAPAYIGAGRAQELAVNVVLPLLHARATRQGHEAEAAHYMSLYHRMAKLPDNEIIREMSRQLAGPPWPNPATSARRQQGLLHLQRLLRGAR